MENQKTKIISIVALVALALTVITATYAYFQAQTGEGSQTDIKINANTVDTFTFETGSAINLSLDQTSFASGAGNQTGSTYASAKLTANNKTNSATNNYNLYLNISDNNFSYTQSTSYPEILLTIKDASNNEITSISGLEYKTVTDGKGASISGFDITTKTGLITLLSNRKITTTSTKTDTWNITATFVNYNADQSKNAGKSFSGQVLISKDSFDDYTPNTINTLSATKSGTNLTVNLNVEQGSNEIDKYYYAIEESNGIAMLNNNENKVQRLSNKLAANTLTYVESTSSSHTFTGITDNSEYEIYAYAVDKKKIKTNTYSYNLSTTSYILPSITSVTTNSTSNSVTINVTASKGANNISKYYYSIDNGNTFIESTSNSYKFTSLLEDTNYRVVIKVMDSNSKYSNIYVVNVQTIPTYTLAEYVISQYNGTQGNNNIYYHNSSLANGAGDNSYRYAGSSSTTNNFVCFGSDADTCPEDNLYRIIGVFDSDVKLIKATAATSNLLGTNGAYVADTNYKWSSLTSCPTSSSTYIKINTSKYTHKNTIAIPEPTLGGCNDWKYSSLNIVNLNTNFLNNISTKWSNVIENVTWKVGGHTTNSVTAKAMYTAEITNATKTYGPSDGVSKIGLMYASDYGYAASPNAWTTTLYNYGSASITSVNWMQEGLWEWTLTPNIGTSDNFYVLLVNTGGVKTYGTDSGYNIRPVFYLKTSVEYLSGSGTQSSPIRIN